VLKCSICHIMSHHTSHHISPQQVHFYMIYESVCFLYILAIGDNKNYTEMYSIKKGPCWGEMWCEMWCALCSYTSAVFLFPSKFQIIFVASTQQCRFKYSNSCLDRTIKSVVCWTLSSNKSQENCSCFCLTNRNPARSLLSRAAVWSSLLRFGQHLTDTHFAVFYTVPTCTDLRALMSTITLSFNILFTSIASLYLSSS
jgi:hypothetical protein